LALRFGTSGLRGLVTEMTDRECCLYTLAFLRYVKTRAEPRAVAISGDHRNSTPRIIEAVAFAARQEGLEADYCGFVPTPALTAYGLEHRIPSIMVTGSHIPEDRNGIKYNTPWGEVLKGDETEISVRYRDLEDEEAARLRKGNSAFRQDGGLRQGLRPALTQENPAPRQNYIERYVSFFLPGCLEGLKVVFYQHSSVSRRILPEMLRRLGAHVVEAGWSEAFVPVDTEAVEQTEQLSEWVTEHEASALVTTDGDGDRPLVVDETGKVLRGDVLGILVADFLQADSVSVPVSCNTALERSGRFQDVRRTRIGSPYVIESMLDAVRAGYRRVVGYEANGGFLTATDILHAASETRLKALPTRDAALPIVALLAESLRQARPISALVSCLPPRFSQSGLLRGVPTETGKAIVEEVKEKGQQVVHRVFGDSFGPVEAMDFTDGARITFANEDIVHLRPSGNAPEFRCYTESSSEARASGLKQAALGMLRAALDASLLP
jgi:phosphomannomutase